MIKTFFRFLIIFVLSIQFCYSAEAGVTTSSEINNQKYVAGKFVVKFKKSSGVVNNKALSNVISNYNVQKSSSPFKIANNKEITRKLNLENVFVMNVEPSQDIMQIVRDLSKDPNVEYAEPVYLDEVDDTTPNDALYAQLVHLPQVSAPQAWDLQFGTSDVIIGDIDTGVDWDHEDLKDVIWTNSAEIDSNGIDDDENGYVDDVRGWDFVTGLTNAWDGEDADVADNDPMDFNGHGTHVAGIAAGHTNNEIGISAVSAGAKIMPLRCGYQATDGRGYVPSEFCAEAYIYAADNGAHITNQSSGNSGQLIVDAAYYAFLNGVLIIESAGNGNDVTPSVLGGQSWVISVAAVNNLDEKASYSSFGEYVGISSPGGDFSSGNGNGILSTIIEPSAFYSGSKYVQFQGTSMAAPLVASVAGLVKAYQPEISVIDLYETIIQSADNIDALNPTFIGQLGSGRVNAYRALTEEYTAEPNFVVLSTIIEESGKDVEGDGKLDAGETATVTINLRNVWQNAENVSVELTADQSWPITIESGVAALGSVGGILDTTAWNASPSFSVSCASDAYPTSVKLTLTITGTNFSQTEDYYLSISPSVLLVSDFDGVNKELLDFSSFYLDALGLNEIGFDHVYHSQTPIDANLLNNYNTVIWACEWSFPTLEQSDQTAISTFLDSGGSLFLSGQDIGWQLNEDADFTAIGIPFFNNYLKSTYLADNVGFSHIAGVVDNPITNKIEFDFYQTRRGLTQQFPDGISPLDGAISILNYEDGRSGAISYAGDYRLVYFSFGGFEAISDEASKNLIMGNVVNFLDGVEIDHQRIRDREETVGDYHVEAGITLDTGSVDSVLLYWDTDGEFPFNIAGMPGTGDGNYSALIPAQESGTTVEYLIYVKTSDAKSSVSQKYSFQIGPDNTSPEIELLSEPFWNTVNAFGAAPYQFDVVMDDNLGIDSATTNVNYWVEGQAAQSAKLEYWKENIFQGSFSFTEPVELGSTVNYSFSASDASVSHNEAISDTFSFVVDSMQTIDDFENGTSRWNTGTGWDVSSVSPKFGLFTITDSPDGDYTNNESNPLTFNVPFNLSNYKYAELSFYIKAAMGTGDSLIAEASNDDGTSWTMIANFARSAFSYRHVSGNMTAFTGEGNENVWIRFRLQSDDENVQDGVYIDEPEIKVSTTVTAIGDDELQIPKVFSLKQNYPNPFNPETNLEFNIPQQAKVTLTIYNLLGQQVAELISNKDYQPGKYRVKWVAENDFGAALATGVYVYRLHAVTSKGVTKTFTKKMLLIK